MIGKLILLAGVFLLGLFASAIYGQIAPESPIGLEIPTGSDDRPSPFDRISEDQIHVFQDRIVIDIADAQWSYFADTNSMDPVIDVGTNAIQLVPESEDDIHVGDIVSYESDYSGGIIIHRVVYKGQDEQGTYFVMKGDNNPISDPGKVRFNQTRRVLVGIIY